MYSKGFVFVSYKSWTCGVSGAEISGIKRGRRGKGLVARTIEGCLMNCVQSVLSHGVFHMIHSSDCSSVAAHTVCSSSCFENSISLQKCRHLELQVNSVGAKPHVKYCVLQRTVKIRFKVCEILHLELGNILI